MVTFLSGEGRRGCLALNNSGEKTVHSSEWKIKVKLCRCAFCRLKPGVYILYLTEVENLGRASDGEKIFYKNVSSLAAVFHFPIFSCHTFPV